MSRPEGQNTSMRSDLENRIRAFSPIFDFLQLLWHVVPDEGERFLAIRINFGTVGEFGQKVRREFRKKSCLATVHVRQKPKLKVVRENRGSSRHWITKSELKNDAAAAGS